MTARQNSSGALVRRVYDASPVACAAALTLLLRSTASKTMAAGRLPSTDGRDGTKIKEISADGRIIRD